MPTIETNLKKILFEDCECEEKDTETTLPDIVPIEPNEMMANQLASERPPIEDEEWQPASLSELSSAAQAIAQLVPLEYITKFYHQMHELLSDVITKANEPTQQTEGQIIKRLNYFAEHISKKELDKIQTLALNEYANLLQKYKVIEFNESIKLKNNSDDTKTLASFRQFFVKGYILPSLHYAQKQAKIRAEHLIENLKLPEIINLTVLNQVVGNVAKNSKEIESKLRQDETLSERKIMATVKRIKKKFDEIEKSALPRTENVYEFCQEYWKGLTESKKRNLLMVAFREST